MEIGLCEQTWNARRHEDGKGHPAGGFGMDSVVRHGQDLSAVRFQSSQGLFAVFPSASYVVAAIVQSSDELSCLLHLKVVQKTRG